MVVLTERASWLKVAGAAGGLTPVSAFLFIGLAIASYSQFSWVLNALSDLGVVSGLTATFFNFGLLLSGLLALIFSIGLFILFRESIVGRVGAATFVLACHLKVLAFFLRTSVLFTIFFPWLFLFCYLLPFL